METEAITTKVCARCGKELPTSEFNRCTKSKDGFQSYCKGCQTETARQTYFKKRAVSEGAKSESPLSAYTPRELMLELKLRGYDGELTYVQRIKLGNLS